MGLCQESSLLAMGHTSLSWGSFKCVFKLRVSVMTLKMYHWGTGGRSGLDFCCGCLHGAEGPRILEVVVGRETLVGMRYEMLGLFARVCGSYVWTWSPLTFVEAACLRPASHIFPVSTGGKRVLHTLTLPSLTPRAVRKKVYDSA